VPNDWDDMLPQWRREGRTGPNGPRYAKGSDRRAVRDGKPVGQPKKEGLFGKIVKALKKK